MMMMMMMVAMTWVMILADVIMTMAATFTMTTMMMTKCKGIMIGLLHSAANSPSGMPPRDWVAYIIRNSTKSVSQSGCTKAGP